MDSPKSILCSSGCLCFLMSKTNMYVALTVAALVSLTCIVVMVHIIHNCRERNKRRALLHGRRRVKVDAGTPR